ncbi:MAG: hypothetical protein HQ523_13705 [Lentisphaerae bacterium]|nr:hypothetical protein [Lentisphaerota bacterium]
MALPLLLIVTLVAGLCLVGCETESGTQNNVRITPAAAAILLGQTIELIASGGFEYDWTLEQESWGTLSTRKGSRVLYTSTQDPGASAFTAQQIVTVTSTLATESSDGSNTLGYVQTAEAIITHQTVETGASVTPQNASVKKFESATFTASGAHTYSWSLQYESWGTLTVREGPVTTYTSLDNPGAEEHLQVLTCTTDSGTAAAHIIHEPEGLILRPTSASLQYIGIPYASVTFTATGSGTINWSLGAGVNSTYVTLTTSGNEATITFDTNFDDFDNPRSVTLTATSGDESAIATVSLYGTL